MGTVTLLSAGCPVRQAHPKPQTCHVHKQHIAHMKTLTHAIHAVPVGDGLRALAVAQPRAVAQQQRALDARAAAHIPGQSKLEKQSQ